MSASMRAFAVTAASLGAAAVAGAQVLPIDYSHHWQPNAETVDVAFSGPGLFTFATPNFAGPGDALRRCYGIDTTSGGRNQSAQLESTNFRIAQGFAAANVLPGVDVGLVSVQAGFESDVDGDACFSPFLASAAGNQGGHQVAAAAVIGRINGTQSYAFPYVFDVAFQWAGTTTSALSFQGVGARGVCGTVFGQILVNTIYEVQGPLNGGPQDNQYFLASTTEVTGTGQLAGGAQTATGGVTNGNLLWGTAVFGVDPATSGAIAHSRLIATDPQLGQTAFTPTGLLELCGFIAFNTPGLWAVQDDNEGAGGADWRISTAPVAVVDLRYQDHISGAQTNANVLFKAGISTGPSAVPDPIFDPFIAATGINFPIFLFSVTPSATLIQRPLSWDDLSGLVPAQPGSILLGSQPTVRGGNAVALGGGPAQQTIPASFDAVTQAFLGLSQLTFGRNHIGSDDLFVTGPLTAGGTTPSTSSFFEGLFDNGYPGLASNLNIVSGTSGFGGGPTPVAGGPKPNAAGRRIGVAALGIQLNQLGQVVITEVGNALTIVLQ